MSQEWLHKPSSRIPVTDVAGILFCEMWSLKMLVKRKQEWYANGDNEKYYQ
ncbi:hypothetical protein [Anoxynatronum buryatiense]|uniref:hypothetical protein n=1 Tax=Anoxynatronum buryatiense TaxID=489973 RepID=UPI0024B79894|nr:hypothetical protein [Anoxynatronum buryatiense]